MKHVQGSFPLGTTIRSSDDGYILNTLDGENFDVIDPEGHWVARIVRNLGPAFAALPAIAGWKIEGCEALPNVPGAFDIVVDMHRQGLDVARSHPMADDVERQYIVTHPIRRPLLEYPAGVRRAAG